MASTPPAASGSLSYASAGVDYGPLDAFKRACQKAGATTRDGLAARGYREVADSRGESAYLLEGPDGSLLAHVEEGLGTKNLVADEVAKLTGRCFYRAIGIDTVATIVNDLITCGARPISVAMHAGVGASEWFNDRERAAQLAEGFAEGCRLAGAVWGGGETPTLKGIIDPGTIVLAGSAVGEIRAGTGKRITGDVRDGDAIVFVASSGVQTNGLTLCRAVASRLPGGYRTELPSGITFGEALLAPSVIYVKFVEALQDAGVDVHYVSHVTGHGWRKLMRLDAPLVYTIDTVRPLPELFAFLIERGPIDVREAYATFNMGVGFAAYVAPQQAEQAVALAEAAGYEAWVAGRVSRQGGRKAVEIPPLGIAFDGDSLQLR